MAPRTIIKWLIVAFLALDATLLGMTYYDATTLQHNLSDAYYGAWPNTKSALNDAWDWLASSLASLPIQSIGVAVAVCMALIIVFVLVRNRSDFPVRRRKYEGLYTEHLPIVGLVAAKNPVAALIVTAESLFAGGATRVLIVNDGSDRQESLDVFDEVEKVTDAEVMHLPKNVGKSNALRAGFVHLEETMPARYLIAQVDDDTIAGDLSIPAKMIEQARADIVDVRVETFDGHNLVGLAQQLDYWLINATIKRFQDWIRARLWLSGASVVYSNQAAQVMLMAHSLSQTEDTEGRFRAIKAGLVVRYCSSRKAEFKTMIPETVGQVAKQWQRWAVGNGQVIGIHGFGAGNPRIALVNILSWLNMFTAPILQFFLADWITVPWTVPNVPGMDVVDRVPLAGPLSEALLWMAAFGMTVGIIGAICLRRASLALVGWAIPLMSLLWTCNALIGVAIAIKHPHATSLTWDPPKRMDSKAVAEEVPQLNQEIMVSSDAH